MIAKGIIAWLKHCSFTARTVSNKNGKGLLRQLDTWIWKNKELSFYIDYCWKLCKEKIVFGDKQNILFILKQVVIKMCSGKLLAKISL